ncbi:MAG TPA: type II toxin-antitoxin system Phd/YefM family antitoxin [Acidobacteriaceae bacterium]|jgi:prevent-host-death family protein|nr:type II toxin-antitoxin system Phd/YefM family antitoxin [Acidobacteriaceae bacterium]
MSTQVWTVAEAKAKFSELLYRAQSEGPQRITRHGRTTAIVISGDEWEQKNRRKENLAEFLMNSPLRGSGLKVAPLRGRLPRVKL